MKDFSHKNYPSNREIEDFSRDTDREVMFELTNGVHFWRAVAIVFGILAVAELVLRLV